MDTAIMITALGDKHKALRCFWTVSTVDARTNRFHRRAGRKTAPHNGGGAGTRRGDELLYAGANYR